MKIQRVIAVTTLTLLASAMAIAKPSGPAKIGAYTPEQSVGCPIPTLAQCQNTTYLETDRCGQLQRVNQWTCTSLLKAEMDKEKEKRGEEYSPLPPNLDEDNEGVGKVVKDTSAHGKNQFTPDLYSYTSKAAARDYAVTSVFGTDPYPGYAANKNVVESCEEYAYEKYLDVSEFTRKVAANRNDSLAALKYAYGPSNETWAIGSRHLADPKLYGRDGRSFGTILEGERNKNFFWNIDPNPALPGREKIASAPNLILSLGKVGAGPLLAKTYKPGAKVPNTWAAHRQYGINLLYIPPPEKDPQTTLSIGPIEQDNHQKLQNTFGTVPGKDPHRKRLARELDELFDLQERFRSKMHDWSRLNERYEGSGWSYVVLDGPGGDGVTPPPGHLNPGLGLSINPPKKELGLKAAPSGKPPAHANDIAIEDPETVQRKRVLADMLAILEKADDEGCFEEGITGCDWSPKLFSRAIRNTYADAQDRAYESCQAFTKGSIANAKNLHLVYVDETDPAYKKFNCRIDTTDKITAQQLDDLPAKHDDCVAKKAAFETQKAHDEEIAAAKAAVLAIPDLVSDPGDKNTAPKFKWPSLAKSRDESMGGEKFNMGYDYDFGFDMNAQSDICKFKLLSHANFHTYVTAFDKRFDIISAEALFDSEHGDVKAHAKFGTYNLFSPSVDEHFTKADQEWEWSVTKTVGSGKKDTRLFLDWIVVVVIPVKLEAGISGEAGLDVGLDLTAKGFLNDGTCPSVNLSGKAEPFAEISGYIEAGIDIFVASVGIRGELTIIRASLPFKAGIGAEIINKNAPLLDPSRLNFFTNTSMNLELSTLNGSISVYGKVGWCPFCVKGEKEIASFEGPSYDTEIFDKKYSVNMNQLAIALGLKK